MISDDLSDATGAELLDEPAGEAALLQRGTTMVANTAPTNLSGHPSLAVPNGRDGDGLPTSIQLVGRRFADAATFRAGAVLEAAHGLFPPPAAPALPAPVASAAGTPSQGDAP